MPHLAIGNAQLHYTVRGDGPVVVVLHGMSTHSAYEAANRHDWQAALEQDHTVIAYDARGHGGSTGRPVPDDYRWEALAEDLLTLLDELAPDEPVDGIGASMGTATLLHAAVRSPRRFRRLVLTIPPTAWETRAAQGDTYLQGADVLEQQGLEQLQAVAAEQPVPPAMADLPPYEPDVQEELLPSIFRGAAASDLPSPQEISRVEQPTLLLPWTDDAGHPVSTAALLHDLLPHAELAPAAATADDWRGWPDLVKRHLAG